MNKERYGRILNKVYFSLQKLLKYMQQYKYMLVFYFLDYNLVFLGIVCYIFS